MASRFAVVSVIVILSATFAVDVAVTQVGDKNTISLAGAKKMAAAAEAEAVKNGLHVTIAVVDDGGHLVDLERRDGAPSNTMEVTEEKTPAAGASASQPSFSRTRFHVAVRATPFSTYRKLQRWPVSIRSLWTDRQPL